MKIIFTREDFRQAVKQVYGVDLNNLDVDFEIEGYKQIEGRYKWQETTENLRKVDEDRKVITDSEGRVLDIVKEEKEEKEPKKAKIKNTWAGNLNHHPDYTDYENTVLDFATSNEHKRQVPFFGAETIQCCKARYWKMIDKLGVRESVKFSRINSLPYLVKIESSQSMNDILNEGVNK